MINPIKIINSKTRIIVEKFDSEIKLQTIILVCLSDAPKYLSQNYKIVKYTNDKLGKNYLVDLFDKNIKMGIFVKNFKSEKLEIYL